MINNILVAILCLSLAVSVVKGSYGVCDEMFHPLVFFYICLQRCVNSLLVLNVMFFFCFWPKIREKKEGKIGVRSQKEVKLRGIKGPL